MTLANKGGVSYVINVRFPYQCFFYLGFFHLIFDIYVCVYISMYLLKKWFIIRKV